MVSPPSPMFRSVGGTLSKVICKAEHGREVRALRTGQVSIEIFLSILAKSHAPRAERLPVPLRSSLLLAKLHFFIETQPRYFSLPSSLQSFGEVPWNFQKEMQACKGLLCALRSSPWKRHPVALSPFPCFFIETMSLLARVDDPTLAVELCAG